MKGVFMQRIIPALWFEKEALEAVGGYVALFRDSCIHDITVLPGTSSGDTVVVDFQLANLQFKAISAGPYFSLNPSISLMVACESVEEVDSLHANLSVGGTELMPLGEYAFSKRYAWVQDKYGLSWQLFFHESNEPIPKIRPTLLFSDVACGKAEQALTFYTSVFSNSSVGRISRYEGQEGIDKRAVINYAEASLDGVPILLMDHGMGGDFTFNEAFSLVISCANKEEVDFYWEKLSVVPEAEQCGWLEDAFGVSWQVVPKMIMDILAHGSEVQKERLTKAFLQMKKLDISELKKALE